MINALAHKKLTVDCDHGSFSCTLTISVYHHASISPSILQLDVGHGKGQTVGTAGHSRGDVARSSRPLDRRQVNALGCRACKNDDVAMDNDDGTGGRD